MIPTGPVTKADIEKAINASLLGAEAMSQQARGRSLSAEERGQVRACIEACGVLGRFEIYIREDKLIATSVQFQRNKGEQS